jgi:signal peptidase I
MSGPGTGQQTQSSIVETITTVIISLTLAFVARGFVIEAFVIPTGSMAPTLLGAHARLENPNSGAEWTVSPRPDDYPDRFNRMVANPAMPNLQVTDPLTREAVRFGSVPTRSGDRIFVLKYLPGVYGPERYDSVVFRYPVDPAQNFIKRLVGLPGEEIALVDGEVFSRPASNAKPGEPSDWNGAGWAITRKSERIQRSVWQPVFDSAHTPRRASRDGVRWFRSPWLPSISPDAPVIPTDPVPAGTPTSTGDWTIDDHAVYELKTAGPATLTWNSAEWPINDSLAYNETERSPFGPYPTADVRVRLSIVPEKTPVALEFLLEGLGHQYRGVVDPQTRTARLEMRPTGGESGGDAAWVKLAEGQIPGGSLTPGRASTLEFWHADQTLWLFVDGKRVAHGEYDWNPATRISSAMGISLAAILQRDLVSDGVQTVPIKGKFPPGDTILGVADRYRPAGLRLTFTGGPAKVTRLALDRDLFYRPGFYLPDPSNPRRGQPLLGAHPSQPLVLGPTQYFLCGDNSANSDDGRSWRPPDAWVAKEIDATQGIVPRELLAGKAFVVYFPAPDWSRRVPIPDFGHMRWIW